MRDWMSRQVVTVAPDTLLLEASHLMTERRIRRLPVVENGRLLGILTYGDVRAALPSSLSDQEMSGTAHLITQIRVAQVMTHDPITVSQNATIGHAAELMLRYAISGLPVLDEEKRLVGIITESDIFRLVVHDWRKAQDETSTPYSRYG